MTRAAARARGGGQGKCSSCYADSFKSPTQVTCFIPVGDFGNELASVPLADKFKSAAALLPRRPGDSEIPAGPGAHGRTRTVTRGGPGLTVTQAPRLHQL